jgi:hypothetical protein
MHKLLYVALILLTVLLVAGYFSQRVGQPVGNRTYEGYICELMGDQHSADVYVRVCYLPDDAIEERHTSVVMSNAQLDARGLHEGSDVLVVLDRDGSVRIQ